MASLIGESLNTDLEMEAEGFRGRDGAASWGAVSQSAVFEEDIQSGFNSKRSICENIYDKSVLAPLKLPQKSNNKWACPR